VPSEIDEMELRVNALSTLVGLVMEGQERERELEEERDELLGELELGERERELLRATIDELRGPLTREEAA
jgi:hypothetical protein